MCSHWPLQCVCLRKTRTSSSRSQNTSHAWWLGQTQSWLRFLLKRKPDLGSSVLSSTYICFLILNKCSWFFFFFFLPLLTSPDGYAIHRLECVQIRKIQRPPRLGRIHMFRHCCSFCGSTELVEKSNSGTCVPYVVQLSTVPSSLLVMRGGQGPDGHLSNEQSRFPIAPGAASAFSQIIIRYMERLKF